MVPYSYGEQYIESVLNGLLGFFGTFFGMLSMIILFVGILSYVLQAAGMYVIAKRRGIHHSWLAWIPVGNDWLLGSISDQYQYVARNRIHSRRNVLLGLNLAMIGVAGAILAMGVYILAKDAAGAGFTERVLGAMAALVLLGCIALVIMAIILTVFRYIALYDLYASCSPQSALIYLVLSILLSVTQPFLVYACRNNDMGMPPRRPTP